jgi:hypothetical protein
VKRRRVGLSKKKKKKKKKRRKESINKQEKRKEKKLKNLSGVVKREKGNCVPNLRHFFRLYWVQKCESGSEFSQKCESESKFIVERIFFFIIIYRLL